MLATRASTAHKRQIGAGRPLLGPSKSVFQFSVILAGTVKLAKLLPDGRQQIVGMQYAPDFLGRPFLSRSDVSVETVTDTPLCSFPRATLERMIERSPGLEHRLYLQALAELDDARELLLALGQKTARERVSTFLLVIIRQADRNQSESVEGSQLVNLLPTRSEIADFLGLTIETVSRQLNKLKALGIVAIEPQKGIRILDPERLLAEAGDVDGKALPAKAEAKTALEPEKDCADR